MNPMDIAMRLLKTLPLTGRRQSELGEFHPDLPSSHGPVSQYHGTGDALRHAIMTGGLKPSIGAHGQATYLTPDYDYAQSFAEKHRWGEKDFQGKEHKSSLPMVVGVRAQGLPLRRVQKPPYAPIDISNEPIDPSRLVYHMPPPRPIEETLAEEDDMQDWW
jgi:hypothetical protein